VPDSACAQPRVPDWRRQARREPKPATDYKSLTIAVDYPAVSGDGRKIFFNRIDKTADIYVLENGLK
jgi:hypothetical protein